MNYYFSRNHSIREALGYKNLESSFRTLPLPIVKAKHELCLISINSFRQRFLYLGTNSST